MLGEVSFLTSRESEDQKHHLVNIYNREYTDPGSVLWSFSWKWEESKGVSMRVPKGSLRETETEVQLSEQARPW